MSEPESVCPGQKIEKATFWLCCPYRLAGSDQKVYVGMQGQQGMGMFLRSRWQEGPGAPTSCLNSSSGNWDLGMSPQQLEASPGYLGMRNSPI